MKKKIAPKKLMPFKSGNPPPQSKKAKIMLELARDKVLSHGKRKA